MLIKAALAAVWLAFGVAGWCKYNGENNKACFNWCDPGWLTNIFAIILGPINLLATGSVYGWKNWSWLPLSRKQRWEIFQDTFRILVETQTFTEKDFDK